MRRSSKGPLDHGEELAELQKRFNHLNEQQKTSELHSSSLMLARRWAQRCISVLSRTVRVRPSVIQPRCER